MFGWRNSYHLLFLIVRILSLILLSIVSNFLWAQEDSVKVNKIAPAVYFDYGKAAGSLIPDYKKWEAGLEIIAFTKLQTIVEYGTWNLQPESLIENGNYHVEGTYMRFGLGYLPYIDSESRLGVGFRYAMSDFSDEGDYTIVSESGLQPDVIESFDSKKLTANWWEVVFYSDKAVNGWLTMGVNFRLRFNLYHDPYNVTDVMIVPGYGRAQDKVVPAFNLMLKIEPF